MTASSLTVENELKIFEEVDRKIREREYPKTLLQEIVKNIFCCKRFRDTWVNPNQESFLILIALEGSEKVINQMKSVLAVIAALSALFLNITVPLTLESGEIDNKLFRDIFGCLMATSTMMSFNSLLVSTFMYVQCELCDVSHDTLLFLKRLKEQKRMFIITSSSWGISGMLVSLPGLVMKSSDSYGVIVTVYFSVLVALMIRFTFRQMIKNVIWRRINLQKNAFKNRLGELRGMG